MAVDSTFYTSLQVASAQVCQGYFHSRSKQPARINTSPIFDFFCCTKLVFALPPLRLTCGNLSFLGAQALATASAVSRSKCICGGPNFIHFTWIRVDCRRENCPNGILTTRQSKRLISNTRPFLIVDIAHPCDASYFNLLLDTLEKQSILLEETWIKWTVYVLQ